MSNILLIGVALLGIFGVYVLLWCAEENKNL
jgi:nitrogen fixation-related uncharacterized protein